MEYPLWAEHPLAGVSGLTGARTGADLALLRRIRPGPPESAATTEPPTEPTTKATTQTNTAAVG